MFKINYKHILLTVIVILAFVLVLMFGMPVYRVWQQVWLWLWCKRKNMVSETFQPFLKFKIT
jgi:cell division protein FtsW (lipid II flippase)